MVKRLQTRPDQSGFGARSLERLHHFSCVECKKWWSIGDAPVERNRWFCPWCGCNQLFESRQELSVNSAQGDHA
ncbi:MAG: hypothetical protein VW985_04455 [Gammaproteobacteria bacterium]